MKTLYLSELILPKVRDVYRLHQLLKEALPAEPRILFRSDVRLGVLRSALPSLRLLVQTLNEPDWARLRADLGDAPRVKPVAWELTEGRVFRFRLRANVTRQRKGLTEPSTSSLEGAAYRAARGKRVAIWKEPEQRAWLDRKAAVAGFVIATTDETPSLLLGAHVDGAASLVARSASERAEQRRSHKGLRFDGVSFEGNLVVRDPGSLETAMREGIGPGKAFGFGLLSLARPG